MKEEKSTIAVVPTGTLRQLFVKDIKPSTNNPRSLFDEEPLNTLKESIREHGVLVPLTVFPLKGQEKYGILDGERRYRCCKELEDEGLDIQIPANVVEPPSRIAGLLYMFSIHNFREAWELMPTAISLETIMQDLKEEDNKKLSKLTGLSETQIERCKILLSFEDQYKELSLLEDPKQRVPSNFWIEAYPVINLAIDEYKMERVFVIDNLIEKYRNGKIKSIIHFRRIIEAKKRAVSKEEVEKFEEAFKIYIKDPQQETRQVFDSFLPVRSLKTAINICDDFLTTMSKIESELILEVDSDVIKKMKAIQKYLARLIERIGKDSPNSEN